ncbi:MAG TPA: PhnD/SsuA/transferrin family substrate-binding protein, partial [Caulobacteraceae bacterium]
APLNYLFTPKNVDPANCFKSVRSASHQANFFAVANGVLDAATNNTVGLLFARRETPEIADKLQVIWTSPPLPESSIVARKDLDPAIKEKLRQFFLTYGQDVGPAAAAQRANLARIGVVGFKSADNSHLLPVREMEASHVWLEAKSSGDKARIEAARKALAAVTAQRQDLEARTRIPAAAQ